MSQPTPHQHEDPAAEGSTRAVHLAAMVLSIAEGVARLRAERLAATTGQEERQAAALRARQRTDRAAEWLRRRGSGAVAGRGDPAAARHGPVVPPMAWPAPGPVSVAIVCSPRGAAGQAFPVPVADAMATAPRAARDAVQAATILPARLPTPQLTAGPKPTIGRGGGAR